MGKKGKGTTYTSPDYEKRKEAKASRTGDIVAKVVALTTRGGRYPIEDDGRAQLVAGTPRAESELDRTLESFTGEILGHGRWGQEKEEVENVARWAAKRIKKWRRANARG